MTAADQLLRSNTVLEVPEIRYSRSDSYQKVKAKVLMPGTSCVNVWTSRRDATRVPRAASAAVAISRAVPGAVALGNSSLKRPISTPIVAY